MAGKTKKQILQELEESQKRIQELQQETDSLKNYSFIHESDQKLLHNLRLQAEGHKYVIDLIRKKTSEELTTKVASFQQRTKPLWIGLRPSLSDFLLHLPGALPFGRVLPRLSDMHPCDASPTAVQAL